MNLMLLGIYPWNYDKLSDTVRSMTTELTGVERIFLNPRAETRSLAFRWQEREDSGVRVWNPPFSFLPTRYGIHRIREQLSARALKINADYRLGSDWRDHTVLYVTASTLEQSYEYVMALQPERLVFDILDDNLGFPGIAPDKHAELKRMFLEIANRAERITAVSQYLVDQTREWTGREVIYLPNGVDVDRFRAEPAGGEPADLANIPHPRLTFMGALTSWIDMRLLEKSARALPNAQFVIVGPVFESVDQGSMDKMKQLPNAHFLGAKPFADVARYMHASDVLLLPRTYDPYSLACDPLKLYEYLATGKPVVSTGHPSAERFSDVVFIGRDDESFIEGIKQALRRDPDIAGQQAGLADSLSWKTRADKLIGLLRE
jgi:glycosyltransferase involved in cell wall biosynthesis